ncbi:ABC transporter substrate-binding protein [Paenibacillus rhizoplanae]|uniref:ABC transporter substrate-binding protein n=1 Tax=Paenibacillus rhizoplanae TaxID=1917181 RepID=UPI003616BBCB
MSMLLAACGGNGNTKGTPDAGSTGAPGTGAEATAAAEPVKLEFWTIALQPTFNDYFNNLITQYEGSHPGVTVEWKDYPYDAISQRLLTSTASGKSPDVVNLNTEFASQLGSKGALLNLNEYLTDEQAKSYFEGIYNSTVFDGKAYALPWYTGTEVLFMNKKLVEKAGLDPANPPQTREELVEWARQVHEKPEQPGMPSSWSPSCSRSTESRS